MKHRWKKIALLVSVAAALVLAGAVALAVTHGGGETMTLREMLDEYYRQEVGAVSDQTIYNMQHSLPGVIQQIMDVEYAEITRDDFLVCRENIAAKPCRDGTHRRIWDHIRSIARFAEEKFGLENRTRDINSFPVRARKVTPYIEADHIKDLFAVVDDRMLFCIFALYLATAARLGELTALEPQDIDLTQRRIHIDKTCKYTCTEGRGFKIVYYAKTSGSVGYVSIPAWLVEPLRILMQDGRKYVFHNNCDEPIRGCRLRYQLKRFCRIAHLPEITPKGIRKTSACYLQDCAVPITAIAGHMRHSSTRTTQRYYLDDRPKTDYRVGVALEALNLNLLADVCKGVAHG